MSHKMLKCNEIGELYYKCYINKQCHETNDKIIRYKDINLKCSFISQLYKICISVK